MAVLLTAALFGLNYLFDGAVLGAVTAWVKHERTADFYLVVKCLQERENAYAQSLLVRQSGAAGYIFQQKEYMVIYSVYLDQEDAKAVAAKNPQTKLIVKKILINDAPYEQVCAALSELIKAGEQLESGEIYEAKFLEICASIRSRLTEQKNGYYKENRAGKEYLSLIELLTGGLSSLSAPSPSRLKLLSDLRYTVSSALINMPSK